MWEPLGFRAETKDLPVKERGEGEGKKEKGGGEREMEENRTDGDSAGVPQVWPSTHHLQLKPPPFFPVGLMQENFRPRGQGSGNTTGTVRCINSSYLSKKSIQFRRVRETTKVSPLKGSQASGKVRASINFTMVPFHYARSVSQCQGNK